MDHVYKLGWPTTRKLYIGVSSNPRFRVKQHASNKSLVGLAIRKHGKPILEILYSGQRRECMRLEGALTRDLGTVAPNGYNLQEGGTGGSSPSKVSREKMRKSHIGNTISDTTKVKISAAAKNRKPISEETRERIRFSAKKRGMSRAVREAGTRANSKPQSAERKAAQSDRMTRWWANRRLGGV